MERREVHGKIRYSTTFHRRKEREKNLVVNTAATISKRRQLPSAGSANYR
jgi:hypothetical protein